MRARHDAYRAAMLAHGHRSPSEVVLRRVRQRRARRSGRRPATRRGRHAHHRARFSQPIATRSAAWRSSSSSASPCPAISPIVGFDGLEAGATREPTLSTRVAAVRRDRSRRPHDSCWPSSVARASSPRTPVAVGVRRPRVVRMSRRRRSSLATDDGSRLLARRGDDAFRAQHRSRGLDA